MTSNTLDVIIIGSGPAGYVAAIKASQAGLSVGLVEKRENKHLGGTCLNVGCIPTKSLLESAKTWHKLQNLSERGFHFENLSFRWERFVAEKDSLVNTQRKGLQYLMKKNHITLLYGHGSLGVFQDGYHEVVVTTHSGDHAQKTSYKASSVILACGSKVGELAHIAADHQGIYTSDTILDIPEVPKRLCIIGGGVIGMEFASLFAMMGTQVTVVEAADQILATFDRTCVQELIRSWRKYSVTIHTSTLVQQAQKQQVQKVERISTSENASTYKITLAPTTPTESSDSSCNVIESDSILVAVGRKPVSEGLGLENVGIVATKAGFIEVDQHYRTQVPGIYAVGDLIQTPSLAHTASAEAMHVVEIIKGEVSEPIDYKKNPLCIYTYPEIASVGALEEELKAQNIPYQVSSFPFSVMAKAKIEQADAGFIKILSDSESQELLGVHIVGARATEMISEFVLGMSLETTLQELALAIRPHPTLSESITEAAHAAMGETLHL